MYTTVDVLKTRKFSRTYFMFYFLLQVFEKTITLNDFKIGKTIPKTKCSFHVLYIYQNIEKLLTIKLSFPFLIKKT